MNGYIGIFSTFWQNFSVLGQSNFFIGNSGETILKSNDLSLLKNKFKLKKTINLDNNILSIFENLN